MAKFLIDSLQPKLVAQFARIIDRKQLAQSYLFVGPKGAGKLELAEWIALRLFCQNVQDGAPCGECPECERILNHNHPDVMVLKTSTQSIKVDDIRNLKQEMSKTGVEGNRRVFIVEDADKMTAGAANSLLKFFEEPVPGMTVILTASSKNQLLPTILSRAQVITFQSPDRQAVIAKLEEDGANPQLARVAGRLTGNVSEAQELLTAEDFQDRVNRVFQLLDRLADHDPESFVRVQTQLLPVAKDAAAQRQVLALIGLAYADALNRHFEIAATQQLDIPAVAALAKLSSRQLTDDLQAILTAQVRLSQNVTFQSATEQLMLKLLEG
ncbi:DNA polymerase III subunit delta' [Lacticaseibacillus casei]|jgi:DNA polymerase-3 subunit delta'|uniref:DNA polymerase III subunit delta n=1 Tax=Lacticaseibacillus zeae subsp. silagei TaxID=3068307 RepID=A0ABD7Z767_LACZE|nr:MULTISPECIES: DNA polymerase III subunit delta' [Lacticaseibacillus]OFR94633.1 DNA polymerase III subunit delta' [Lactobacillus sp. HMSC068F07]KLI75908.1 DNA polymerase III subunit delta [Lacticaseibacillus casei]MDE3315928.1 DNA polymerase III subunit delta' [Lacticaseibacillus zeae]QVI37134.1 DNA polymerase III subunit delta' [Lacticaseibacillus casei]QXG58928.1 DNA polymerase III subunit delta' [Lacticaseibacillus casei]